MEVFCVFAYINYIDSLKLGIDAVGRAGEFVYGTLSDTSNESDPNKGKCDLEYFINLARDLSDMGVHYLDVKDMAGFLNPCATTILVSALREDIPNVALNIHTYNTSGTGVT